MFSKPTAKLQTPLSWDPATSRNSASTLSEYIVTTMCTPWMNRSSSGRRRGLLAADAYLGTGT